MDNLKVGMFVKYTDHDEEGTFSHIGEIVEIGKKISFDTGSAILSVPLEESNKFSLIRRPKNWKSRGTAISPKLEKTQTTSQVVVRTKKGGTKREQVEALVLANPEMSRKEHIDLVVKEVGMTPAGASTYVSEARKKL